MKGWKKAHKRRRRKLLGTLSGFNRTDVANLKVINRYAASRECDPALRQQIYAFKDLLMGRFGKVIHLTLQTWRSGWYDERAGYGLANCCEHQHVLQAVRIGGMVLHRPTGHFHFVNHETEYWKASAGFGEAKAKCTEFITGRKRDQITSAPDKHSAARAYERLSKRHGKLWTQTETWHVGRPVRTRSGYFEDDWETRRRRPEPLKDFVCHWCKKNRPGIERNLIDRFEICDTCKPKVRTACVG